MANLRIVHFELPADEPEELVKFYRELFGWQIQKLPIPDFEYWLCKTGDGPGIDGAITRRLLPQQAIINYVSVEDIEPHVEKAKALGGKVLVPRTAVPGAGWYCVALDPQGNPLGFWQDDKSAH
jgi:predicted enzyme related to lactoylglutathione lyase